MDIKLNAPVECLDGKHSGHVTGVIVDPETDRLMYLVIKTEDVERMVPVALIRDATPAGVMLACTTARLNEQQLLVESEHVRSIVDHYDYYPWGETKLRYVPETHTVKHEFIPNGEEEIKRGMAIFARDGRIGRIGDVIVDPENDHITHIVLREGHLWGQRDVTIPVSAIGKIEMGDVQLNLTKQEIEALPSVHVKRWMPFAQ
jgi:sporulation protein YlmC with PRC-barrel domain